MTNSILDNPDNMVVADASTEQPQRTITWEELRNSQHHQDDFLEKLERESKRDPISGRITDGPLGPDNHPDMKVFFTREPIHSKYLSALNDEPTSVIKEFITIIPPRNKFSKDFLTKHTIVEEIDKWRFPKEYEAFKQGKQGDFANTALLLLDWPEIQAHADIISQLKSIGVNSVEDLAKVSEFEGSKHVRDFKNWKNKAKGYVRNKNKPETQIELEGKLEKQDAEIASLHQKLAAMLELMEAQRNGAPPEPKKSYYKRKESDSE